MKGTIGRTIVVHEVTFINGIIVDEKPAFTEPKTIKLLGEQTADSISKEVKKQAGTDLVMITATVKTEQLYEMSVDDFLKHSKPVIKETPNTNATGTDTEK
jgi:hypothetical protein